MADKRSRNELTAPGVPEIEAERERAVRVARSILRSPNVHTPDGDVAVLARQLLRALAITDKE